MQTSTYLLKSSLRFFNPRLVGEKGNISFSFIAVLQETKNNIFDANLIESATDTAKSEMLKRLYVCEQIDLCESKNIDAAAFICIDKGSKANNKFYLSLGAPVIVLDTEATVDEVRSFMIMTLFAVHQDEDLRSSLLNALASSINVDHLLQLATHYLKCPFSVLSPSYRILSHTLKYGWPNKKDIPGLIQECIRTGYLPDTVINEMRSTETLGKIISSKRAIHVTDSDGTEMLCVSLHVNNVYVGMLSMYFSTRPITWRDYEIMPFLGQIVCICLEKNNYYTYDSGIPWRSFLRDLIKSPPNVEVATKRLELMNIRFSDRLILIQIQANEHERSQNNVPLNIIQHQIDSIFSDSMSIILDESVLVIKNIDANTTIPSIEIETLEEFLLKNNLYAGISNIFSNILELKIYYEQVNETIRFGMHENLEQHIFWHKDYIVDHLMSICKQYIPLKSIAHPAWFILRDYDKKYKTSYSETLVVYLSNMGNMSECAKELKVHYNTMKYRMKIIQDICEINLSDIKTIINLQISLKVFDIADQNDSKH